MNLEKFTKLEEKANELFGSKSVVSVAVIKIADKGYNVRINMQGTPFEISAMGKTVEDAEKLAYDTFENNLNDALKDSLFATQPIEKYQEIKLTDDQFKKLFNHEMLIGKEYLNELMQNTKALMCRLEDGKYECVIESPYMCLHARGTSKMAEFAILCAIANAGDIFRPLLIRA